MVNERLSPVRGPRRHESAIKWAKRGIREIWGIYGPNRRSRLTSARGPGPADSAEAINPAQIADSGVGHGAVDTEQVDGFTVWRHAGCGEIRRRLPAGAGVDRRRGVPVAEVRDRDLGHHRTARPPAAAGRDRLGPGRRPAPAGADPP